MYEEIKFSKSAILKESQDLEASSSIYLIFSNSFEPTVGLLDIHSLVFDKKVHIYVPTSYKKFDIMR